MSGLESLLIKAKGAARRGETEAARTLYRQILDRHPRNSRAITALRSLDTPRGSPAQKRFDRMVVAYRTGAMEEAAEIGEELARAHPESHGVLNLLGAALLALDRNREAERAFARAISADRTIPASYNNRAIALKRLGHVEEAERTYRQVIAVAPGYADAPYNLANLLESTGRREEAAQWYERTLELDPDYTEAHYNLGNLHAAAGRRNEAIACFDAAIARKSDHGDAHNNRGGELLAQQRAEEALQAFERALAIAPANTNALVNKGKALVMLERRPEAISAFRGALTLDPGNKSARLQALFEEAQICSWSKRGEYPLTDGPEAGTVQPFASLPFVDNPAHQMRRSVACAAGMFPQQPASLPEPPPSPDGRIRIGYFSSDFHDHATMFLMSGFFREHDTSRFDVHLYSYGVRREDDAARRALRERFDNFIEIGPLSDAEVLARARNDGLDIAVDLKGYTMGTRTRLFGQRLAPVQVSWMGYPGTIGHACMDYLIADPVVMPQGAEVHFTEQVVRLPHCYQANDDSRSIVPDTRGRAGWGLPETGVVFASFNQCYKISAREWDIWMRLLGDVEGSVLWLLRSNEWAEANLRREAEARGIDPKRLVFAPLVTHGEHLGRLGLADLFLDTFNVGAHTTASDALWAGLPVLTLTGRQFAARVATSLVHALGLPELAVTSEGDYAALARALARHPDRLSGLRKRLAEARRNSPLFDTKAYTRSVEQAFSMMHQKRVAGQPPEAFSVE